jgi:hypothetical protein
VLRGRGHGWSCLQGLNVAVAASRIARGLCFAVDKYGLVLSVALRIVALHAQLYEVRAKSQQIRTLKPRLWFSDLLDSFA